MYGWGIDDVLNLTIPELNLIQGAMLERLQKQVKAAKTGQVPGEKVSLEDALRHELADKVEEV